MLTSASNSCCEETLQILRSALPFSCVHVCMHLMQLTDLVVVGHVLGAEPLAVRGAAQHPPTYTCTYTYTLAST